MTHKKLILRLIVATMVFLVFILPLKAQIPDTLQNMPNLLLPKFTRGIVKLKAGSTYTAVLNYDLVGQQMVFLQRKLTIVLDDPQLVDTIHLANRTFVPFEKRFYEILLSGPITLFKQNRSYVESKGTPIGYGALSQTTSPSYVQRIFESTGVINLTIPKNYNIVDDSEYWIRRNGELSHFATKKQFLKIFPDREKELSQYIKKDKTDFKSTVSIVQLVQYCSELY